MFNLKSRRSREQHYRRVSCDSSRLYRGIFTDVVEEGGEPHHSEAIAVEGSNDVPIDDPLLESTEHVVEVEVLVGIRSRVDDAALG